MIDGRDALQQRIVPELEELWPVVKKLDAVRQHVLIDMAFSMGVKGLLAKVRGSSRVPPLAHRSGRDADFAVGQPR
jgi:hypothetical protein